MKQYFIFFLCIFHTAQAVVVGSDTAVSRQAHANFPAADSDNEIRGFAAMESGFALENSSTTCLFNSYFPISGDVSLNAGTLNLGRPLIIQEEVRLTNVGSIDGNFYSLTCTTTQGFTLPSGPAVGTTSPGVLTLVDDINASADVYSVDWSYDSTYIAAGMQELFDELKVFSFDGTTLTQEESLDMGDPVYTVRWHPSNYFLAVGRDSASGDELYIYEYNTGTSTLTLKDGLGLTRHVKAIAWNPAGTHIVVVGENTDGDDSWIRVYSVSGAGIMTNVDGQNFDRDVDFTNNAIMWDSTGDYFVVGIKANEDWNELRVHNFNGSVISLTASNNIAQTVSAVAWLQGTDYIAVGLSGGSERLRIYERSGSSLTEKTSARVGESLSVLAVDWSPDGTQLAIGRAIGTGTEFRVYDFDSGAVTLTLSSDLDSSTDVNTVRWSPNGTYIARGDDNNMVGVYNIPGVSGDPFFGTSFIFNNLSVQFNSDITLEKNILFQGTCVLDGNGHMLDLQQTAGLVIDDGASLICKNIVLKNISDDRIKCLDTAGNISLCNVEWLLDGNFTFTQGSIEIAGDVRITGTHIFTYQSAQTSTIKSGATWYFDTGMTFKYDTSASSLLAMEDSTAVLHLYEATLYSTVPGLHLTKGTLVVEGTCSVESDATVQAEGIIFGDGVSAANNLTVKVFPESGLDLNSGFLVKKNV